MNILAVRPYYILNICASLCAQIIALILVYKLSPEDYGYYSLITSAAQIMFIICSGWTNATVINIGTKDYKETGAYKEVIVYRAIIVFSCWILISLLFLILNNVIIEFVGGGDNYILTYMFFCGLVFNDFVYQIFYPGEKNNFQTITMFVFNAGILSFVLFYVKHLYQYIHIYTILQFFLFSFLICSFLWIYRKQRVIFNESKFKKILSYSFWQLFGVIGVYLINLGSNYILRGNNIPVDEIGLYNFAYKVFCCFVPIFALLGVVIPKWIHDPIIPQKIVHIKKRMFPILGLLFGVYILVYLILPLFLSFINKEDYFGSVNMYLYLFPGFIFYSINQILNIILLNTPNYKYSQIIAITQGVILILSCIILVGCYGVYGAIASNVISYMSGTLYFMYVYNKKIKKTLL